MTDSVTANNTIAEAGRATLTPKPSFDKTMHQPPRIDHWGYNKEPKMRMCDDGSNILKSAVQVPDWWGGQKDTNGNELAKKTRTELMNKRRADNLPHISYDLDGDGFVGGRDYVLSKLYDKDKDGKLNAEEKKNAMDAIKNVRTFSFNICRASRTSSSGTWSKPVPRDPSVLCKSAEFSLTARISCPLLELTLSTPCPRWSLTPTTLRSSSSSV